MELVLIGDFTKARSDIEQMIRKMGGKVGTKIHDRVAAIISTADEVQKMDTQMRYARMYDIQVVSEDFLNETKCPDVDPIGYILSESICDWGGDVSLAKMRQIHLFQINNETTIENRIFIWFQPYDRIAENDVASRIETVFYEESMPKKITYKWKGKFWFD